MKVKQLLLSLFALLTATTAWADVEINETNFPDEIFRNWILSQKYGKDGVLTDKEIAGVDSIGVSEMDIQSLKGIEYFTELTILICNNNELTELDVSKNKKLIVLNCNANHLTSLNVLGCTKLKGLGCFLNQLASLDLSKNTALQDLHCYYNGLTVLNLSKNKKLEMLCCDHNRLTTLNLSKNWNLTYVSCVNNQITGADMDALVKSLPLKSDRGHELHIIGHETDQNEMTAAHVAIAKSRGWEPYAYNGKTFYKYLGSDRKLKGIKINEENFPDVNFREWVSSQEYGGDGVLTNAEIAKVLYIKLSRKNIQNLKGIEYFKELKHLICSNIQLYSLDVSKNSKLEMLLCDNNKLSALDVSQNTALKELRCHSNRLATLKVSGCTALKSLWCHNNQLTALDVSGDKILTEIICCQNNINDAAMDALVESLPSVNGKIIVVQNTDEHNVMTVEQVNAAKAKGWTVLEH